MKAINFYNHLIEELTKEGYKEEDIILVSSLDQSEISEFSQVKPMLDKTTYVESHDKKFISAIGGMNFHLSDGSVLTYTDLDNEYDYEVFDDKFTITYSAEKLKSKIEVSNIQVKTKIVKYRSMFWSDYGLGLLHPKEDPHLRIEKFHVPLIGTGDKRMILTSINGNCLIDFNQSIGLLGICTRYFESEDDVTNAVEFFKQLPINWTDTLVQTIAGKFPKEPKPISTALSFVGMANFFSEAVKHESKS